MIHTKFQCCAGGVALALLLSACDLFVDDGTRIERARNHTAVQDYRAAEIELKNVLRADPQNAEARALLGDALLHSGDSETAIKELQRARELGAPADQHLPPLARALLREGRLNELVNLNPNEIEAPAVRAGVVALVGRAEFGLGDTRAAERRFEQALAVDATQSDALLGLAQVARERGEVESASARLDTLLANNPDDAEGLSARGRLQYAQGDYTAAGHSFERALEQTPPERTRERLVLLSGLLEAQLARQDVEAAQRTVAQLIEAFGDNPLAQLQAARVDYAVGDYASAVTRSQQVVARAPEFEPARLLLAAAAMADGNRVLAATQLQTVLNINPGNDVARKLLARVHMELDSPTQAIEVLQPLLSASSDDPELLTLAGSASLRSGQQESGVDLLERGAVLSGDNPALALESASALLAAGEIERAIDMLEALPDTERIGQRELLLMLAKLRSGDKDGARAEVQAILDSRPGDTDAHRLAGGFHLAVREFDAARAQFEKVLELRPGDRSADMNLARIDIAEGNLEAAEQRMHARLKSQPGDLMALSVLARIAAQRGDREAAVALIEQTREANPDAPDPPLRLARNYLAVGNLALAEQRGKQAVRNAPNQPDPHLVLGTALLEAGRASEALSSFERAVKLAPNYVDAHLQLGRAQEKLRLVDAAFASFERAFELDPDSVAARIAVAKGQLRRGNRQAAEDIADAMVEEFPDRVEPLILKGDIAAHSGSFAAALSAYDAAAVIEPSRNLAARRTEMRRRLGYENAYSVLEEWLRERPEDLIAHGLLAQSYLAAGRFDQALTEYETVMAASPDAGTAMTIAIIYDKTGSLDDAQVWLDRAIELDPKLVPARAAKASLELRRGNAGRAEAIARELRQQHPESAEIHQLEGAALAAQGKYDAAAAAFGRASAIAPSGELALRIFDARQRAGDADAWLVLEKWVADHPDDRRVAMQLARQYDALGRTDEAIEVYRRVLYGEPENFIVLNNLAWLYYKRGEDSDMQRGLNAAERAYAQRSDMAAVVDTYGWLLLEDGQADKALPLLRQASQDAPDQAEIGYHYAVALHRSGSSDQARSVLDRLLASDGVFDSRAEAEALRQQL